MAREESDFLGSVKVPSKAFYGIQTVRGFQNFQISGIRIPPVLNQSIVKVKICAALANTELKVLSPRIGKAIVDAAKQVLKGKYNDEFILDVFQAGAGTPWHMNVNEVIANIANKKLGGKLGEYKFVDPHNHVNYGQSSNDVIPSAMRLAVLDTLPECISSIKELSTTLHSKARLWMNIPKSGRTHMMDAVPMNLGQGVMGWALTIQRHVDVILNALPRFSKVSLGGSAVGTGLNTHPQFRKEVMKQLSQVMKTRISAANPFEQTAFMSDFLHLSSLLRNLASDLIKIINDLMLLGSGPRTGFNELILPAVEPGSSIMPAKVNPSMPEMMNMVCFQVIGNDTTIQQAASQGNLELNVYGPVIAYNILQSLQILSNGIREFNLRCIKGLKANKKQLIKNFERSPSIGTVLNPVIGYNKTAKLIQESLKKDISIKDLAVKKGLITKKEADKLFDPKTLLKK